MRFSERLREQADGRDHAAVHERRVVQRLAAVHLAGAEQHEVLGPQIVHLATARHAPPPSHHLADGPEIVEMERERLHDALERDELHARHGPNGAMRRFSAPMSGSASRAPRTSGRTLQDSIVSIQNLSSKQETIPRTAPSRLYEIAAEAVGGRYREVGWTADFTHKRKKSGR